MTSPSDDTDALAALLQRLTEGSGGVPGSTLGRLWRTAFAGLRVGAGTVAARLRGLERADLGGLSPQAVARLVVSLGQLKGVAMKIGQMLSYLDPTLPSETRRLLAVLQVRSQPTAAEQVERILREDLGPRAEALLATLERKPAASASIGQVHRARLPDGTAVAVKVRHPGIDDAIRADFRGARLGLPLARLLAPGTDVREVIAEAETRFLEECDYTLEARRQARFAALYAEDSVLAVPDIVPDWCAPRVLTTRWCDARGFEAWLAEGPAAEERNAVGRALYVSYVGTLYRHGLFNADPHPGNLLFPGQGRVVVLDYGCVREFDPATVAALAGLSAAVRKDDEAGMRRELLTLGVPDAGRSFEPTRELLRGFFSPLLRPGPRPIEAGLHLSASEVLRSKRAILKLALPGQMLFLFRIRFGLYSVLSRVGAVLDWAALEEELIDAAGR